MIVTAYHGRRRRGGRSGSCHPKNNLFWQIIGLCTFRLRSVIFGHGPKLIHWHPKDWEATTPMQVWTQNEPITFRFAPVRTGLPSALFLIITLEIVIRAVRCSRQVVIVVRRIDCTISFKFRIERSITKESWYYRTQFKTDRRSAIGKANYVIILPESVNDSLSDGRYVLSGVSLLFMFRVLLGDHWISRKLFIETNH